MLTITKESKERAKQVIWHGCHGQHNVLARVLTEALDALCVEAGEGWVEIDDSRALTFEKGDYHLIYFKRNWRWCLFKNGANVAARTDKTLSPAEAQAWADGEIDRREKANSCTGPIYCDKPAPTFGPGSRFRLLNGDEIVVVKFGYGKDSRGQVGAISIKTYTLVPPGIFWDFDDLQAALTAAGATPVEDQL